MRKHAIESGKVKYLFVGEAKTYGDKNAKEKMDQEWRSATYRGKNEKGLQCLR